MYTGNAISSYPTSNNSVLLGWMVSKRVSYTETSYIADELGSERTTDQSQAFVFGSLYTARWVAGTQLSTQWEVKPAWQEW